jgi:branched-chain amino acid transport system substrate-binding protein
MKKFVVGPCLGFAAALASSPGGRYHRRSRSITGQYAFGEQLKRGAEMAVADINAAGGVNGEKLVLEVGDDACDPEAGRADCQPDGVERHQVHGRPLLFGFLDPGL